MPTIPIKFTVEEGFAVRATSTISDCIVFRSLTPSKKDAIAMASRLQEENNKETGQQEKRKKKS
jgi:hypothetical protein